MRDSIKTPLVTAAIIVLAAVAAVAYVALTGTALPWASQEPPTEFLLIASASDDTGATVAQIITLVDTSAGTATAVAPDTKATIAGTSYDEIKDALPFGGGAAVASAYAQVTGAEEAYSYIVIDAPGLRDEINDQGGVRVDIPLSTDVFDGDKLYTFTQGAHVLSGEEFIALLKARPYFTTAQKQRMDSALSEALVHVAGGWTRSIASTLMEGTFETDMTEETVKGLTGSLRSLAP